MVRWMFDSVQTCTMQESILGFLTSNNVWDEVPQSSPAVPALVYVQRGMLSASPTVAMAPLLYA